MYLLRSFEVVKIRTKLITNRANVIVSDKFPHFGFGTDQKWHTI